jgi:hypothetical protein
MLRANLRFYATTEDDPGHKVDLPVQMTPAKEFTYLCL